MMNKSNLSYNQPATLVLFDVDGTLVYSIGKRDSRCFAHTYEHIYGKAFPSIDWKRYPHVNDTTIFKTVIAEHFDRDISDGEIPTFLEHYTQALLTLRAETPHYFLEIPGAASAIKRLLDHPEYAVAVATGGWQRPAVIKLAHIGVATENLLICGADDKVSREDIIEAALAASSEAGQVYEKIVYIGDAIWDVQTTRRMGMDFLGISFSTEQNILQQAGAVHVLDDFSDFDLFIKTLALAEPPLAMGAK
jgi:phosphoglycolate phosphatase-like HAD superfamily hydrolase